MDHSVSLTRLQENENVRPMYRKLGLLNGLLVGLALVAVIWRAEIATAVQLPVKTQYGPLLLGSLVIILITIVAGWLTTRRENSLISLLVWLATAVFLAVFLSYLPLQGRTAIPWLATSRFWGLPVYSPIPGGNFTLLAAGFFLILGLVVLALVQDQRLRRILDDWESGWRIGFSGWLWLLLPILLVALLANLTLSNTNRTATRALVRVDQVIEKALNEENDLRELARQEEINYAAIENVRSQLGGGYTLQVGALTSSNPLALTPVVVVAHFENGTWINCQVEEDRLIACNDASPPYTAGFTSFISDAPLPENCNACALEIEPQWQSWLQARRQNLGNAPQVQYEAQWGSYVATSVAAAAGDYQIECHFHGIHTIKLERCIEKASN